MRLSCLLVAALFAFGGVNLARSRPAAAAGATQGCLDQPLASGRWRVRVTGVQPIHRKSPFKDVASSGWGVWVEWTNAGARAPSLPLTTGAVDWQLYYSDGTNLGLFDFDASTELSKSGTGVLRMGEDQSGLSEFFDRSFPPGVTRKGVLKFWYPNDPKYAAKPTKFVISGAPYSRPDFGTLRFKLNCTK